MFVDFPLLQIGKLIGTPIPSLHGHYVMSTSLCCQTVLYLTNETKNQELLNFDNLLNRPLNQASLSGSKDVNFISKFAAEQLRYHYRFSLDLLVKTGFINRECMALGFSSILQHLHYHEPGNYLFCLLLGSDLMPKICKDFKEFPGQVALEVFTILCHIFNVEKLPKQLLKSADKTKLCLPPLQEKVRKMFEAFNKSTMDNFVDFINAFQEGEIIHMKNACSLPMSGLSFFHPKNSTASTDVASDLNRLRNRFLSFSNSAAIHHSLLSFMAVRSPFFGLSGLRDFQSPREIFETIRHDVYFEEKLIPCLMNISDDTLHISNYAVTFYNDGQGIKLLRDYHMKSGQYWYKMKDWDLLLKVIVKCCDAMKSQNDPVAETFRYIQKNFNIRFINLNRNIIDEQLEKVVVSESIDMQSGSRSSIRRHQVDEIKTHVADEELDAE